jgi:hypothetical protein
MTITATLPAEDVSNARNMSCEKELVNRLISIAYIDGEFRQVVDARFYMGRSANSSKVYCSIWVSYPDHWTSGHGTASGYGYHKESAALDSAIESAGIKLDARIDGVGDSAMREAIEAITRACGYDTFHITQ